MTGTRTSSVLERMAPSTPRLLFWLAIAVTLMVTGVGLSRLPILKPYSLEVILPFFAGILSSAALTSWSYNPIERENARAIAEFWGPFARNSYIVLPSSDPSGARKDGMVERSPFTPYHDAVAAS